MQFMGVKIEGDEWRNVTVRGMDKITLQNLHYFLEKADGKRQVTLSVPYETVADDVPKAFKYIVKDVRQISDALLCYDGITDNVKMRFIGGFLADIKHKEITFYLADFSLHHYEEMMAHQDIIKWVK